MDDDDPADADAVARASPSPSGFGRRPGARWRYPSAETERLSFVLAGRVELAPDVKLELLSELSERVRLDRVCELLELASEAVERQRRAAERAATNGRVDLG